MLDFAFGIAAVFFFLVFLAFFLVVTVPLNGTLVRLRANYNPKGLQLDEEDGVQPHTGPVVTSFFVMMARVKRLEGWSGLFKGMMPTLLSNTVLTLFGALFLDASPSNPRNHGVYNAPSTGIIGTLVYSIFLMLVSLPAVIITYRAITTPHRLPWFNPVQSLHILLTPTERRKPWILYLTPGLLAAEVLHITYVVIGLRTFRILLLPALSDPETATPDQISIPKLVIYLSVVVLSTIVLCPLEVIATRLSVQRNHASAEYNSVAQEIDGDAEDVADYAGAEEDVIGLRSEMDPYLGLVDCGKRIVIEEGWRALYRGWWLTLLFGGFGAFS
ncbi:mitochondrial carrier [Stereum hirsutum FP-91666 SS1]|uniref:mitochondrial carrier n=1 Tax=Stereum hirsutum (strain FP-91666) TaxID=721885 RepID=UPI0004449658|nr:mitochondrial carrier [Stereum hirsutum FP-91666 SS1]EIM83099.1 mitochondrial carrier [Stereum hirsutum FP-91666 SS1]